MSIKDERKRASGESLKGKSLRQSDPGLLNQVASTSGVYCFKTCNYAHLQLAVLHPAEVTPHNQLVRFQTIWAGRHKCGSLPTLTAHVGVEELPLNQHTLACRRIRMTIARKKARKSMSELLEGKNPQPYVVPEGEIRELAANLRIGEAHAAGLCLLVIGEAVKAIVEGKTESRETNVRLIKRIQSEEECRPIRQIIKAIIAAIEQGAEGIYAACLTITRFLEFTFEFVPDQRTAERLYKEKLRRIRKTTRSSR